MAIGRICRKAEASVFNLSGAGLGGKRKRE